MPAETATLENNTRQSTSFAGRRIEQLGSSGTNAAKALGNIPKKLLNGLGSITQVAFPLVLDSLERNHCILCVTENFDVSLLAGQYQSYTTYKNKSGNGSFSFTVYFLVF